MKRKTNLKGSCACCDQSECINLFRQSSNDSLIGGELYLYSQLTHTRIVEEQLEKHICSNGRLLKCACFITGTLYDLFPDDYVVITSNEVVRDMKASFYLAMSGHYRQAVLIQRCVFENFLYGLYFHTESNSFAKSAEDKMEVRHKFLRWIDGGFRKSDTDLREIIQKGGLISREENKSWGTLFNNLSQFVHTIKKTPTGNAIKYGNVEIKSCYSEVEFDKNSLIEWSEFYQAVLSLILHRLVVLFPEVKREEAGMQALALLRVEFKGEDTSNNTYLTALLKMRAGKR